MIVEAFEIKYKKLPYETEGKVLNEWFSFNPPLLVASLETSLLVYNAMVNFSCEGKKVGIGDRSSWKYVTWGEVSIWQGEMKVDVKKMMVKGAGG